MFSYLKNLVSASKVTYATHFTISKMYIRSSCQIDDSLLPLNASFITDLPALLYTFCHNQEACFILSKLFIFHNFYSKDSVESGFGSKGKIFLQNQKYIYMHRWELYSTINVISH